MNVKKHAIALEIKNSLWSIKIVVIESMKTMITKKC